MRLIRILAASAMILSFVPAGMAAVTPDHAMPVQLVRGGGGHGGGFGGHGGGFHGGGFRGGYAMHRSFGYRPWGAYGYSVYPYAYSCPYPYYYSYAACGFPSG
jgi:hypothetical protein